MRTIILILLSLLVLNCAEKGPNEELLLQVEQLQVKNDSLVKLLERPKPVANYWFDAEFDGMIFLENGISDPEGFIEDSLREKTHLIPLKPVLGGTMRFGKIQLLSREWLISEFDDGHIQGKALFKFSLNTDGVLEFERMQYLGPE